MKDLKTSPEQFEVFQNFYNKKATIYSCAVAVFFLLIFIAPIFCNEVVNWFSFYLAFAVYLICMFWKSEDKILIGSSAKNEPESFDFFKSSTGFVFFLFAMGYEFFYFGWEYSKVVVLYALMCGLYYVGAFAQLPFYFSGKFIDQKFFLIAMIAFKFGLIFLLGALIAGIFGGSWGLNVPFLF
jgi:hypothetical protein